jgi:hypothetical protein
MPIFGLVGPFSAVPGPRSSRRCRNILAARRACRRRQHDATGPGLGEPLHDPYGGLDPKSQPQRTVFGGAAPLAKLVKSLKKYHRSDTNPYARTGSTEEECHCPRGAAPSVQEAYPPPRTRPRPARCGPAGKHLTPMKSQARSWSILSGPGWKLHEKM